MENIKSLYYERFIQHVVETYGPTLRQIKPGHCMKITGLALKELKALLPLLRKINKELSVYILSEDETGDDYIHATKLIELRNDPQKQVLILVPANSRTSAEDSYGDATFQNLSVSDLQDSFVQKLIDEIPEEQKSIWSQLVDLLNAEMVISQNEVISYILYLELNHFSNKAWGNGLFVFGLWPDRELMKDENSIRRRFMLNKEKASSVIADFSQTAADRVSMLPIKRGTIQRKLMEFLTSANGIDDAVSLFETILNEHSEFNYADIPWIESGETGPVKITVDLMTGKDSKKELVKDTDGTYVLNIMKGKKSKVAFKIATDPSPKDNPSIVSFEIAMVRVDDFSEVGVIKKAKVGKNKGAVRKMSVNIADGMFDEGSYILRVRALDENGIVLDTERKFKEEQVQAAWEDEKEANPGLQMEQYRLEGHYAYSNESDAFSIICDNEETIEGQIDKRAKVNSFSQALILYRSAHLAKGEDLTVPEGSSERNVWVEGNLNSTYHFDFGAAYAFQIQMSKKLIQLENAFLKNGDQLGHVEALLGGNPTDAYLMNPYDTAKREPLFIAVSDLDIPEELISLRRDLFEIIQESAEDMKGLTSTFDLMTNLGLIKEYLNEYNNWLSAEHEKDLDEKDVVKLQNIDTVLLTVEMPDGTTNKVKLISPLHPLRLGWMMNLFELYQDWEERTLECPKYKKAWYRKLDKLFQGQLPLNIAPIVLSDDTLKEAFQYSGELTYGWGMYARPTKTEEVFSSGSRQLKSYVSMLLNLAREKRVDSDVNVEMVFRHLLNYSISHPYVDKLVINLFNAGDAATFAEALMTLEKYGIGKGLTYEIRLFTDENMLQSGEAFKELLDPETAVASDAEAFSQASTNRLFPKLRFSLNKTSDFIKNHDNYQAHLSFLVNPFAVTTEPVRPNVLSRSFYLNGTICKNVVDAKQVGKTFVWNRYFSNKALPNPVSESANLEVGIFARLQDMIGKMISSTIEESVPATTLRLKEGDMMLLSFIHDSSDWVITFDKNMGPEFYDLPCIGNSDIPYLLDYVPNDETTGISSYLTAKPTSEIAALLTPLFKEYGVDIESKKNFKQILEDVRSVSSSLIMQVNTTSNKGFEVLGTVLTKRFLEKKRISSEAFMIPIDLHQNLFEDLDSENKEHADDLVVKIDTKKKEIVFIVVEIKCRNANYSHEELNQKIDSQIENTIIALRSHFEIAQDGHDRLDRELKTLELKSLLEFYIDRASRYGQLNPEKAYEYKVFLNKLSEGYTLTFKRLGIIFDFLQEKRQHKEFYGDTVIYTMGKTVVDQVLDENSDLNTHELQEEDKDFMKFFGCVSSPVKTKVITGGKNYVDNSDGNIVSDTNIAFSKKSGDKENTETSHKGNDVSVVFGGEPKSQENGENTEKTVTTELKKSDKEKESSPKAITIEPDYKEPKVDVIVGKNSETPQFGVLGKMVSNGRIVGLDLNECNTISLFGVQGAGKSYTIGSVTEMVLKQFSNVNKLPAPMAGVIFHYSESMDYAPEFTSMVYPNDEAGQIAKLKAEYGAEPGSVKDVVLLAPEAQVELRKAQYPDVEVHPIGFDSSELSVRDWLFLLAAIGNDSAYIKELKQIMKANRNHMSLSNIRAGVEASNHLSSSQRNLAQSKLDFAKEYISDGCKLQQYLRPGRLIIVDLRDEFIEKEEALGLFVVMLNIFSSVMAVDGKSFNKFIVFDEAHKYMNNKDLVDSITTAIREMRHKGVSIMIASQDPMSLPTEIIELSSLVVLHRFSSPAWVKHVQKAITPLQTLTATEMAALGSGEAYLWASKATDKSITQRPIKISIRPRVTKHGGDTIQAVH